MAGSPPLTLGLRLHPSPAAAGPARERGWLGARGELGGAQRGWGPTGGRRGRGSEKPREFRVPGSCRTWVLGRIRFTARLPPPKAKAARVQGGSPLPLANPTSRQPPFFPDPGPEGEGSCHRRKKGARLPREARLRQVSCASARPCAPRPPTPAAGPLSPRIMHVPGAPSALPPQKDTINVLGGRPGEQEGGG